ncbi:DMT family transporter [Geobacter sp. AOG2]|uniref:DMT family transporter n=1 Tax=Geobacter sp. AOG2 TaxID=1566347 RepID=UPI001CC34971|nr:EamA family transporter [Geobacter sp. AOG2]
MKPMPSNDRQALRGCCALAAAASIWGGMYVVSKYTLDYIPPFTLLWLRYVTAFATLYPLARRQQAAPLNRSDHRAFIAIGFVGYFVSVGLQFIGTRLSSAHNGAILTSASPAFILLFAWFMLGERLTPRKLLSVLLASIGVLIVVGWDSTATGGRVLAGNLALIGAAVTWALLSVLARKFSAGLSPLVITTWAIFWATLMTTPAMIIEWRFLPVSGLGNPLLWGAVLYLGVVSTAGAFYLWNKGMSLVEAGTGSIFFFLQPVVGALLGWLVLGEHLSLSFFAGGGVILLAVLIVSYRRA